ncbi:MAG: hypothetical protein LBG95_07570 [Treponema sp.]|jgi:hypothetical protein|nr:hypothetical protein [Treponema sp.]
MRKRIFPRILWFLLLNCVVFILLVMLQFTHRGNFSQRIGNMLISGRYSQKTGALSNEGLLPVDGGASVGFGGLEYRLSFSSSASAGFCLVDAENNRHLIFPEYLSFTENGVTFILPGGTELSFVSKSPTIQDMREKQDIAYELQISVKFSDGISAIEIPVRTQRSSIIRNSDNATLNILYNGSRYQFSRLMPSLESGQIILLASAPSITYHVATDKKEFIPAQYIIPQAQTTQSFSEAVSRWTSRNYALWAQMGTLTDEDTVIAWCGEALRQGNYNQAVSAVPASFSSSPLRSWESAVYQFDRRIGVWERANRTIDAFEREKASLVSRLLTEKSSGLFAENHLVEFLAIRENNQLIEKFLSFTEETEPSSVTLEMSPGILENCLDMGKWRPNAANPFASFAENIYQLVADGLRGLGDQAFVFSDGQASLEFNLRLGKAMYEWGEKSGNEVWTGLGRSLVLSVISQDNDAGSIPALLTISGTGEFIPSGERIGSAKLYRLLYGSEYLPHWTATGASGIWAWTAASSVNITQNNQQMDIAIRFPVGETHYVMLCNVRPFPLLQIYSTNWRRAVDFESYYNSSGWYYFEQEQALILKINQRSNVETVRIYYTVPRTPEPEPPPEPEQLAPSTERRSYPMERPYSY